MTDAFETAFRMVLRDEGTEYTDNSADRGGPTRFGVTIPTMSEYLGRPATEGDIQTLTEPMASAIYRKLYWDRICGDQITHPEVAIALFNMAVLNGVSGAIKEAQEALGLPADGKMGPKTLYYLNNGITPQAFVSRFILAQVDHFLGIAMNDPTQLRFLKGWINRAVRLTEVLS